MTATANAAIRAQIIREAEAALAQYPQYRGHWNGASWRLVRVTRAIRTRLGLAFAAGDITLARFDRGERFATAWSARNRVDTSVEIGRLELLEEEGGR